MHRLLRLFRIIRTAAAYNITPLLPLPRYVRVVLWCCTIGVRRRQHRLPIEQRLTHCLTTLGPLFIKFGQLLSTRHDMVDEQFVAALQTLQDNCPPLPYTVIEDVLSRAYQQSGGVATVFAHIDKTPLACASIAQIHRATLVSGETVVAKVVRPDIHAIITRDIAVLSWLAGIIEWLFSRNGGIRPTALVAQLRKTLARETNMLTEAAHATRMRETLVDLNFVTLPTIYWQHCRQDVLVLSYLRGIDIKNINALDAAGIDRKQLAINGMRLVFTQVFVHNFFHADLHPGNMLVTDDGKLALLDFGMVGALTDRDQWYLGQMYHNMFRRRYDEVTRLHIAAGWVPPHTNPVDFESAVRSACEPIMHRPLRDLSIAEVLIQLFRTARTFQMQVPPELMLFDKTLLQIEGLGRQLDPDFNIRDSGEQLLNELFAPHRTLQRRHKRLRAAVSANMQALPTILPLAQQVLTALTGQQQSQRRPVWVFGVAAGVGAAIATVLTVALIA